MVEFHDQGVGARTEQHANKIAEGNICYLEHLEGAMPAHI
jgi:hypothetical protein